MRNNRQEHGSPLAADASDWCFSIAGEPRLEELMEDPMMGLIWRRDGLDPPRARQTLFELQAMVRAGQEAQAAG
jgi:hypothetical protein